MILKNNKIITGSAIILTAVVLIILRIHRVSLTLTPQDDAVIQLILEEQNVNTTDIRATYESEIKFIENIQNAVLKIAPVNEGIPFNVQREPAELYQSASGLCYDRSRAIENIEKIWFFRPAYRAVLNHQNRIKN